MDTVHLYSLSTTVLRASYRIHHTTNTQTHCLCVTLLCSFSRWELQIQVPYDHGWPLGIKMKALLVSNTRGGNNDGRVTTVTLDDYERERQARLRQRAFEKGIKEYPSKDDNDLQSTILETRQWDYKQSTKNPLFHLLTEEDRMQLLLEASTPENSDTIDYSIRKSPTKNDHVNNSPKSKISKRNNKNGSGERTGSGSSSFAEQYNETYTQVEVHRVRNELEELRFQRTGRGHRGCQCRKLDVYLLPPHGGGGKKAHHRRLAVKRVKEELQKRQLLPSTHKTREELEILLHHAVEREACCISNDCPCVRSGIDCQADVCDCWHDSHQSKESKQQQQHKHASTTHDVQERCGNPNGMYAVDLERIHEVRQQILKACKAEFSKSKNNSNSHGNNMMVCCMPISPHTPAPFPSD